MTLGLKSVLKDNLSGILFACIIIAAVVIISVNVNISHYASQLNNTETMFPIVPSSLTIIIFEILVINILILCYIFSAGGKIT